MKAHLIALIAFAAVLSSLGESVQAYPRYYRHYSGYHHGYWHHGYWYGGFWHLAYWYPGPITVVVVPN
jgi:hypothetical protein